MRRGGLRVGLQPYHQYRAFRLTAPRLCPRASQTLRYQVRDTRPTALAQMHFLLLGPQRCAHKLNHWFRFGKTGCKTSVHMLCKIYTKQCTSMGYISNTPPWCLASCLFELKHHSSLQVSHCTAISDVSCKQRSSMTAGRTNHDQPF